MTYNDENLPSNLSLSKVDVQLFLKRLRKDLDGRKIRYYLVGEYGDMNARPHYHAIVFGIDKRDEQMVFDAWGKGFVQIKPVINERINYVTAYINKKLYGKDMYGDRVAPFALMSKRPAIGLKWLEKEQNRESVLQNLGIRHEGRIKPIPRYFCKKLDDVITDEFVKNRHNEKAFERLSKPVDNYGDMEKIYLNDKAVRRQAEADQNALLSMKNRQ